MDFKKNDRVQNQLALYYFFEYGKQTLKNESEVAEIKDSIEKNIGKNSFLSKDYIFQSIDIAVEMANLSVKDFKEFIYDDVKFARKQERGR